ncbi:uncharacterized protein C11orf96-like isoform X2 [Apus apus]|uniref:uncharacterized protein C11orf96-like isoform X2 n=1 Tax=Apus apus TaxID=8895 RepID=UPI0021F8E1FB|nr:uncharacterized protein C11orf96-like isoform X2 [Apus apus]
MSRGICRRSSSASWRCCSGAGRGTSCRAAKTRRQLEPDAQPRLGQGRGAQERHSPASARRRRDRSSGSPCARSTSRRQGEGGESHGSAEGWQRAGRAMACPEQPPASSGRQREEPIALVLRRTPSDPQCCSAPLCASKTAELRVQLLSSAAQIPPASVSAGRAPGAQRLPREMSSRSLLQQGWAGRLWAAALPPVE